MNDERSASCLLADDEERRPLGLGGSFEPGGVYSQSQFSKLLGVHYRTTERWRLQGVKARDGSGRRVRPDFVPVGGQYKISGQAAREFLAALNPDRVDELAATDDRRPRRHSVTRAALLAAGF